MSQLPKDTRLAFIGAGNMAEALIRGLIQTGACQAEQIVAVDVRADRRETLRERYDIAVGGDPAAAAAEANILVLATKPQSFPTMLPQIRGAYAQNTLVISIAAGVPLAALEERLGSETRLVRAMPNTPALIGSGATAIAAGSQAQPQDLELASTIFSSVGLCVTVVESALDAVTGLSGSGPAYVFLIIEALSDAGVKVGLHRSIAQSLAAQTVMGSAKMLIETGSHPGQLKDQVTSPGGTAIAGLHTLEQGSLRTTLINAVEAATERAKQLGAAFEQSAS